MEISDHGTVYRAKFYVEGGVLHADIEGWHQATLCGHIPVGELMRALLAERIMELKAKPLPLRRRFRPGPAH